jgi:hypothetical protein
MSSWSGRILSRVNVSVCTTSLVVADLDLNDFTRLATLHTVSRNMRLLLVPVEGTVTNMSLGQEAMNNSY